MSKGKVTISLERYDELIEIEKQKEKYDLSVETKRMNDNDFNNKIIKFIVMLRKSTHQNIRFDFNVVDVNDNKVDLDSEKSITNIIVNFFQVSDPSQFGRSFGFMFKLIQQ